VRDGARVTLAVVDALRRSRLRPSRSSTHWVAPDLRARVWAAYRGQVSPMGAVLVGRPLEGGDNPLSPSAAFCRLMRVGDQFLRALNDAYDGRPVWTDLLGDEAYAQGASAGLALRDILFPD
jgi:hypothetical protein